LFHEAAAMGSSLRLLYSTYLNACLMA
jgi:hypothetical protein